MIDCVRHLNHRACIDHHYIVLEDIVSGTQM